MADLEFYVGVRPDLNEYSYSGAIVRRPQPKDGLHSMEISTGTFAKLVIDCTRSTAQWAPSIHAVKILLISFGIVVHGTGEFNDRVRTLLRYHSDNKVLFDLAWGEVQNQMKPQDLSYLLGCHYDEAAGLVLPARLSLRPGP